MCRSSQTLSGRSYLERKEKYLAKIVNLLDLGKDEMGRSREMSHANHRTPVPGGGV